MNGSPPGTARRPLEGVLIADFSRVLAGPLCTMTLADLGARVIKVERPGTGDETRGWGPPFSATGSTYFESVNRNKESITLDLADPTNLGHARALALRADVLVQNFKPGTMEKLGLGYAQLSADNPGLVYASISGFGPAGGAQLPGYDFIVQAVGGLMSITGEPGGEPVKAGVALIDVLTAKDAAIGILAALNARVHTGAGAQLELNLLSSLQGALANQGQAYLGAGTVPGPMGNAHPSIVPYQLLACADAPLAVACGNNTQFAALCTELGIPDLAADRRFATNPDRVVHREALIPLLETALASDAAGNWQRRLTAVGVPAGRIGGIDEGIELARELGLDPLIDVHDANGAITGSQLRNPIAWTPPIDPPAMAPPALGEHTAAVLHWLTSAEPHER